MKVGRLWWWSVTGPRKTMPLQQYTAATIRKPGEKVKSLRKARNNDEEKKNKRKRQRPTREVTYNIPKHSYDMYIRPRRARGGGYFFTSAWLSATMKIHPAHASSFSSDHIRAHSNFRLPLRIPPPPGYVPKILGRLSALFTNFSDGADNYVQLLSVMQKQLNASINTSWRQTRIIHHSDTCCKNTPPCAQGRKSLGPSFSLVLLGIHPGKQQPKNSSFVSRHVAARMVFMPLEADTTE